MKKAFLSFLLMLIPILASVAREKVNINGIWYFLVPEENNASVTYGNWNIDQDKPDEPIVYSDGRYSGKIVIPSTVNYKGETYNVTWIRDEAFYCCTGLTSVSIPNSVKQIGYQAFEGCSNLTSVNIPNSVKYIDFGAFEDCSSLSLVTIPNSVIEIGAYAFAGCTNLKNINIPDGVTEIKKETFSGCSSLTSINIPKNIKTIEKGAFSGCSSLTSINIPKNVTTIGDWAFGGCGLTSVIIPNGVTSIGGSAFYGCSSLSFVTIPNSINTIGNQAFDQLHLKEIYCYAEIIPEISLNEIYHEAKYNVFRGGSYWSATLHVPAASIDDYKTSEPWNNFKNIVPLEIKPANKGYGVDYTKDIDKSACLDGFMLDNVFYSINDEDGTYDSENGCIVLNKPTADVTVKGLIGKDIFSKEFRDNFTGIVLKLAPDSGYVNVNAETTGDMALKIKIGNDTPKTTVLDGKQLASFQYNVTEETYVYIYAGDKTTQARNTRAESTDNSLKLYGIEISDTANDINSITIDSANTFIYDLQGNKLNKVRKGMNIIRTKESSTRKIVVK